MARFRRPRAAGRPSRRLRWYGSTFNDSGQDVLRATAILSRESQEELTDPTLTRIRGVYTAAQNSAGNTDTQPNALLYYGLIILDEDAVAASAIPDPAQNEDLDKPWLYVMGCRLTIGSTHEPMFNSSGVFVNLRTGYTHYGHSYTRDVIDIKAQRKLKRGEGLYLVRSLDFLAGDSNVADFALFRTLLKE